MLLAVSALALSPAQPLTSASEGSRDQVLSPTTGDGVGLALEVTGQTPATAPGAAASSISLLAKRPHVSRPLPTRRTALVGNGTALPNNGRVAVILRGEAFRNGGRNLDWDSQAGCQPDARGWQEMATRSFMEMMVQPLEAHGNEVDLFVTETSGQGKPCEMTDSLRTLFEEKPTASTASSGRIKAFAPIARLEGQAESVRFALDLFKNSSSAPEAYDLILMVRNDMIWTLAVNDWPPPADFSKFAFLSLCQGSAGGPDDWANHKFDRSHASCVNDVLLYMPGSMFAALDGVVGKPGAKCFEPDFRHGAGHECYEVIADAIGEPPTFATDYVPRGTVRRADPLGWLIGTPAKRGDIKNGVPPSAEPATGR